MWYFTAKNRRVKEELVQSYEQSIEETCTEHRLDIIAYYLTTDEKTEVTIEYFDKVQFHDFLYNREKLNNGIVQKFREPRARTIR